MVALHAHQYVAMLDELGLGDGRLLFSHFNILCTSLDDGLVSLMADEDVVKLLEYMPMFREFDVYVEEVVLVIEQHMIEVSVIASLSQDDMNMPWGMVARYTNDYASISELEADEVDLKLKDEEPSEVDLEVEDECMSTRSTSSNLFSPLRDPESLIRRRNLGEPSSLLDFKEVMSIPHNNMGPPPARPPHQPNNGPPPVVRPNGPAPRSMECL
ncbi:hypothetical protein Tco_1113750 [Tanacetum coccineum]|uniref:Uncharacterized protein n=1 Tax=Tanacetum coccineum TaxID=301880 RepID=A0ABQ5IT64_9ASTR